MNRSKTHKTSRGIILCRHCPSTGVPQVCVTLSRWTYAFTNFVFGKYRWWDIARIRKHCASMTTHEKLLVWTCDFDRVWHHIWLNIPRPEDEFYPFYERSRAKFSRVVGQGGTRIREILKNTGTGELTWNAPKGREKCGEEPQQTAAREVEEETNISPAQYSVFPNITPITTSHEDETTVYISQWSLAQMLQNDTPVSINFGNREQIQEITGIRWAGVRELRQMNLERGAIENIKLGLRLFKRESRRTDPV